ncbi:oligopeptide/dipeptide ABC transporter ATP-binding protein [Kibdelosporangium banguiense]|uniref:Oligopeptide/dipeptide ABC transporter ATP-binding protein n=1 Tax=Kibdelosporangium banguiense TaxID=1365924 RepID=A0ABS4TPX4_9PSEU|nr:ABC transporter ATP-binding protein [Kibdelosporangium banguiense]MBP2326457.1 oligopeptide/dipeptide ABC transporter ATP-binding protein [Kibdelosporangium banguiense]
MTDERLLDIEHLHVELPARRRGGEPRVVIHDVSLSVAPGESVGVVGESGSGKSMTTKAVSRLLPRGAATTGEIIFRGSSVLGLSGRELAQFRARRISTIYQDPRAHINPLRTIGDFLAEGVVASGAMTRTAALEAACALLRDVGVPDAERRLTQYPHQLSGGLLQRMMIVMALLPSPDLVLADEPTTALDVTVQSDVMAVLAEQIRDRSLGLLFITHDLDLAAAVTDSLAVMYAGVIVERGPSREVSTNPRHPYTAALLASRPSLSSVTRLTAIPGRPISAFEAGPGCVFAARCAYATDRCRAERPAPQLIEGRSVACHRAEELGSVLPKVAMA